MTPVFDNNNVQEGDGGGSGGGSSSSSSSSISVHIEVDIDPPPRGPGDPDDRQLERLGLPTHHVHFSTDGGGGGGGVVDPAAVAPDGAQQREEILRPDDISIVTYQPSGQKLPSADSPDDYPQDDPSAYQVRVRISSISLSF